MQLSAGTTRAFLRNVGKNKNIRMKYRTDIDGLRALAVLPVVAFHAQIPPFGGGFIGVDVFFVISGYLISSIILSEIDAGQFSLLAFYERRVRRILPALIAVLLVTSLLAYSYLMPIELVAYAKSLLAAVFSGSNFYFWSVSGYFDQASDQQPLLHTWSLSVEEQFYVLFPLILILIRRAFPNRLRLFVIAIAIVSCAVSAVEVFYTPLMAFYFPHSRAWELLSGTILAMNIIPPIRRRLLNNLLSGGGFCLIIGGILAFRTTTPFPGLNALVPCLGAGMIIHGGHGPETLTSRVLSTPPLVFVGLISYSIYLWHWPLIFFQNNFSILFAGLPGPLGKIILFLSSIALGALSWWFVERPFRRGPLKPSLPQLFTAAGAATMAISAVGALVLVSNGMPWRFSAAQVQAASYIGYDSSSDYRKGECFTSSDVGDATSFADLKTDTCLRQVRGKRNYLLFGDSYAADLWYGLSRTLTGVNVMQATGAGCKPLLGIQVAAGPAGERCAKLTRYIFTDYLVNNKVDALLVAGSWIDGDVPGLARTLDWARSSGISVVLFGPKVQYDAPLPRLLVAALRDGDAHLPDRHRPATFEDLDKVVAELARRKGVTYVSYFDLLCTSGSCQYSDDNGRPLAFDRGHLTKWGSTAIAGKVERIRLP